MTFKSYFLCERALYLKLVAVATGAVVGALLRVAGVVTVVSADFVLGTEPIVLIEDRFPGFMMLSSNGGDSDASLGIPRIAHEYGIPVLVRASVWREPLCPQLGRELRQAQLRLTLSQHAGEMPVE